MMREMMMMDDTPVFPSLMIGNDDWSCCCSFFLVSSSPRLAAQAAAPAERHLSSKADATLATDLRRVYIRDGEQQRHIVLRELQWCCNV